MSVPEHLRRDKGPCCLCGAGILAGDFRDRASYREAHVTGLCQQCQDRVYLARGPDDPRAYPIHDGGVVAVRAFQRRVAELVLLPFRMVVPESGPARLVWEARHLVRAGPWLDRIDLLNELEPMRSLMAGHQASASAYSSFRDPRLEAFLESLHLLVGLDAHSLDAVARVCRLRDDLARASLADEVPWQEVLGRELRPLESWCGPEPRPLSTLRVCAVLASLLVEAGRDGLRPLDHLVVSRRTLFEEPDDA